MNSKTVSPELEHEYLCYYSKFSIALGTFMTVLAADDVFEFGAQSTLISTGYYILMTVCTAITLYYLFAGSRFTKMAFSINAWKGTYNDEFLNTVNLIAYKIAFFGVMLVAAFGAIGGRSVEVLSIEAISVFALAVGFLSYGVTALTQLRDVNE